MPSFHFDQEDRFVIEGYASRRPFASFLPGIAGPLGAPLWVFYVNRGQAIASFGVETKDCPISEFEPANRAYQTTPYTGFRTFLKLDSVAGATLYEPFAPWNAGDACRMCIGMNELELQADNAGQGLQTRVTYFTLTGEPFAGLVRRVTVTNTGAAPRDLEMLDGLARVIPYGANDRGLKDMGRTIEAWMAVFNLEARLPFYRFQASFVDTADVSEIQAGHFALAFDDTGELLMPFVDPVVVFGHNTALSAPDGFAAAPLAALGEQEQITTGRTPCGFFGAAAHLAPGAAKSWSMIIGHAASLEQVRHERTRLAQPSYIMQQRQAARRLVDDLTGVIATHTSSPSFDAYARQSFLDNVLRGGWPLLLGDAAKPSVYHIYSRRHGDLERDYNYFYLAAEPYSQGNAAYRDLNQNRRNDVLFEPGIGAYNVLSFLNLIQADGYNPLVVEGARFTLAPEHHAVVLALTDQPEALAPILAQSFTPGQLLKTAASHEVGLKVSPEAFASAALANAHQHFEASFGEGYWIDHWFYNLDLIETYLAVYPDRKAGLLFAEDTVSYFDSPALVQPRDLKYVLTDKGVRQYNAVVEDEEKAALIAARDVAPNLMRVAEGKGPVYRTTVFAKLVALALLKFATLDPLGMGVEMEAGKPGWYDALNGLPALFGASLCETYELARLLDFLLDAIDARRDHAVQLPAEQMTLLQAVSGALAAWRASGDEERDFRYWDSVATAREAYRASIRLGFDGAVVSLSLDALGDWLRDFRNKVSAGIARAVEMNAALPGAPPTYVAYTVTDYEVLDTTDAQGRPHVRATRCAPRVLPPFLEGPTHAMKVQPDAEQARSLYAAIRASELYDRKLGMYRVNASLDDQPHEIGRARAFTPGWLENASIWLHMEYKYLLEVLKAELYEAFFEDFKRAAVCFQDPDIYGRSPLEASSFLVSSSHPDASLHGAGFVARLTGATAEFLSLWHVMLAGRQPFFLRDGELCLALRPTLPGWLFDEQNQVCFTFLGCIPVTIHNPERVDTWRSTARDGRRRVVLKMRDAAPITFDGGLIPAPYAETVRDKQVEAIDLYL